MQKIALAVLAVSAAVPAQSVAAQAPPMLAPTQTVAGTLLDINAEGEVSRVPDIALINAGVVTRAQSATEAIQQNARRMESVRAALKRAGIADRDLQTSSINLNPEYRYQENQPPQLVGYTASNSLQVRFRDIRSTGRILDALVAEGANQINGPTLIIDKPDEALAEARLNALTAGRARAEVYARALGKRVVRLLSVSESGGHNVPPPIPMAAARMAEGMGGDTQISPGEQKLQVSLNMRFELQ